MLRLPHSVPFAAEEQAPSGAVRMPLFAAQTWAEMPAIAALAVAVAAGTIALVHAVALPDFTWQFWLAAVAGLAFCVASHWDCFGSRSGGWSAGRAVRRVLGASLALGLFVLPPLGVWLNLFNGQWLVPLDVTTDGNLLVSVFIGWIMIASVFAVGAAPPQDSPAAKDSASRLGAASDRSESGRAERAVAAVRSLPLTAPLLPGLSLFGLLNVVSVDTIISVCFVFFAAAAMYLLAYDKQLSHRSLLVSPLAVAAHAVDAVDIRAASVDSHDVDAASADRPGTVAQAQRVAGQYLLLCAVWLGLFAVGAALLYYPLTTVLPIHLSGGLSRVRPGSRFSSFDWRSPSHIMLLRGGYYALSDEEVLEITVESGTSSGLLRGKTFEFYNQSPVGTQWEDQVPARGNSKNVSVLNDAPVQLKPPLPAQVAGMLSRGVVVEKVRPLLNRGDNVLYASGEPFLTQGSFSELRVMPDNTIYATGRLSVGASAQYVIQSQVTTPRPAVLLQAAGMTSSKLRTWRTDMYLDQFLQTGSAQTTTQMKQIAAQILARARARGEAVTTPFQKVQAVEKYLIEICEYSLDTPTIPNNQDAVLFFLTESRVGACDMFASAMALLLRSMDVPTRIATGFRLPQETLPETAPDASQPDAVSDAASSSTMSDALGGVSSGAPESGAAPEGTLAAPGTSGDEPGAAPSDAMKQAGGVMVRQRDAHAWVEYFVEGYGWLTRDPTDGTREAPPSVSRQIAQAFQLQQLRSSRLLLLPGAGVALLLIGMLWTVLEKRGVSAGTRRTACADEVGRARIAAVHAAAVRVLVSRVPVLKLVASSQTAGHMGRTPREIEAAVLSAPLPSAAKQEFAALTYLFIAAHYSADFPASQIGADQLRDCLARLQRALR